MTCAPGKFMEHLLSPECQAMELLWSLSTKTSEVNPVLAGYFSRTVTVLMQKYQKEALDYCGSVALNGSWKGSSCGCTACLWPSSLLDF